MTEHYITFSLQVDEATKLRDDLFYPAVREAESSLRAFLAQNLPGWRVRDEFEVDIEPLELCQLEYANTGADDSTVIELALYAGREIPSYPTGDKLFAFCVPGLLKDVPPLLIKHFASFGVNLQPGQAEYTMTRTYTDSGVYKL